MEILKHECGVALIRLRKPLEYYKEKYGTICYGLDKLYLLMEKQHNRGQEAAGMACVKINGNPGEEFIFRERALGSGAIQEIFANAHQSIASSEKEGYDMPYIGEVYMGHLRYSTTGKSGLSYVHPFLRRNNWKARNLLLCGNFNMTNVDEIFSHLVEEGQHPRIYSDTFLLLEQLGHGLDQEHAKLCARYEAEGLKGQKLIQQVEKDIDTRGIMKQSSPLWDGGYVICGALGSGSIFTLRDPHGIRPAFWYCDDEIVVVASERPVIQTTLNVDAASVRELGPGEMLTVDKDGDVNVAQLLEPGKNEKCSFERIYFSRGSDMDIYNERKQLGRELAPQIVEAVDGDLENTVISYIPNTAETAFFGMVEGLRKVNPDVRAEKIVIKDIKLRTFIAEGASRNDLAAHVYDVTYGQVKPGDNLVVIDDSIVRGTTLKQSILRMLDRLHPGKIVVVSSSPQVRYPDYYGIDMSRLGEFAAFRAAISLLKKRGLSSVIDEVYARCKSQAGLAKEDMVNHVKAIYDCFTDDEISDEIAKMLTPEGTHAEVKLIYQSLEGLHNAIPGHPGDWYFSGYYPTPGGVKMLNRAFMNWYEGHADAR
ncbi:MAG: amidophosphoribosyltransferase [Bacteroidales bacterium]|nr:amidophosphoribosyltransferase [Bacteroidales bacterium]